MRRHGLYLNAVEHFPTLQGGSLRWTISTRPEVEESARAYLDAERAVGLVDFDYYKQFGRRVEQLRDSLRDLLVSLRADGQTIAAYGAAAKGSTLVNYVGISTDLVDYVVDRNVHKHGLFMPGTHLPIRPTEALMETMPDYVLVLAWNYKDEIAEQQTEYRRRGGRFIVPVPVPEVL
jgi:hypothetical protein